MNNNPFRDVNPYEAPIVAELNEPRRGSFPWATVAGLAGLFLAGVCSMLANIALELPILWLAGGLLILASGLLFLVRLAVWIVTVGFTTGAW